MLDKGLINSAAKNMTRQLTEREYKETMGSSTMIDVTTTAKPTVDIWQYVKYLVAQGIVSDYVFNNRLVEKVYRNNKQTFDHVLLPTSNKHFFIVIIVDCDLKLIYGHYKLDLAKEYLLD